MPRANARAASRQSVYKNEGVYSSTQGYAGFSFVSDGGTPPAYYATNADVAMGVALTNAPWFLVEFVIPLQGDKGQTGDGTRGVYIRSATAPTAPTGTWDGSVLTLMGGWSATIPTGTDILYRADATLDSTNNTVTFSTPERWTGPTGPEPTDTRLNTLITTLLTAMDLTTATEVNALIQQYLNDNAYRTDASIREIINEAYQNVLRDLGAIQVQYALNPTSDTDWHDSLTFYDRHRIRLNNPDADWNIIMGGSVSTGGLSLTFQYTSDITDTDLYHESPQVDTDTNYRFKVGTGDYGDWQQIGGGGGGSRNLKGDLLATVTIPSGTFADATPFAWSVESGVTLVSSETLPAGTYENLDSDDNTALANGMLQIPYAHGTHPTQQGWLFEMLRDNTVFHSRLVTFGEFPYSVAQNRDYVVFGTDILIQLRMAKPGDFSGDFSYPVFVVRTFAVYDQVNDVDHTVIPAGANYEIKLYIAEN